MNSRDLSEPGAGRPARFGRLAVGILLVASATGFLVYKATGDNLTYYREVDELMAATGDMEGKLRVSGDVVEGSVARDEETRELSFEITNPGSGAGTRIPVVYAGTVPDIFRPGIQVVVEGRMEENGTFRAETLLAKCPSKYQAAGELEPSTDPGR
ncbi:MAG TPA: cytochrome c maturation protein CcmE [Gemmatimonadota bacterium]|nr:cytochrome c maturation protein CcmE [Gemmatimonadota bacterium]